MTDIVFLNGQYLEASSALINPLDRGFLLADGLFETIACLSGRAIALQAHWNRLLRGAVQLGLTVPFDLKAVRAIVSTLLERNNLQNESGVRLTLTRGPSSSRGLSTPNQVTPTFLVQSFPLSSHSSSLNMTVGPMVVNEHSLLNGFKTLAYTEHIYAKQQAMSHGFDDALLLNTKGELVSATAANFFLLMDGCLLTPALTCGALPGITREQHMSRGLQHGISVKEGVLLPKDLSRAQGAFLSNSLYPIQPIHVIDQCRYDIQDLNAFLSPLL